VTDRRTSLKHSIILAESDEFSTGDQAEYNTSCRRGRFAPVSNAKIARCPLLYGAAWNPDFALL
jgi:hypothetical protein